MKDKAGFKKLTGREKVLLSVAIILAAALVAVLTSGGGLAGLFDDTNIVDQKVYTSFYSGNTNIELPQQFNTAELLEVHFINVGQGDAIFIRFPDGKDMLIDCGSGTTASKEIRDDFSDYLIALNVGVLDYLIITHPDSDHVNLAGIVLDYFEVANIYYNDIEPNTKAYTDFLTLADDEGAVLFAIDDDGEHYYIENTEKDYRMDIYAPGYERFDGGNAMSAICLLRYGERRILFTGDAEKSTEEYFMQLVAAPIDIDILKVAHHGSSTGTEEDFLSFLTPEYAVISVGEGKTHDHPSAKVMNRLFAQGIVTYRTNRHGSIVLYIDDSGDFGFLPERNAPVENNSLQRDEKRLSVVDAK